MTTVPTFAGDACVNYSVPYASSLRNSRVQVSKRAYQALMRIPLIPSQDTSARPEYIVVSPDARHAALRTGRNVTLLGADGWQLEGGLRGDITALNDRVIVAGQHLAWNGTSLEVRSTGSPGLVRAFHARSQTVVMERERPPGHRVYPPAVFLLRVWVDQHGVQTSPHWAASVDGRPAAAAIGADGVSVVAMADRTLHVFGTEGDAQGNATAVDHHALAFAPSDLSLIPPYIVLLETTSAGATLHALRGDARPAYTVDVALTPSQPPVDGGEGRIYVVGNGIATIDAGKLTAQTRSEIPLQASAFADGSLAVVAGRELRILGRSGATEQTLEALEPLLVPPAIASDGSVWTASSQAVYVAR